MKPGLLNISKMNVNTANKLMNDIKKDINGNAKRYLENKQFLERMGVFAQTNQVITPDRMTIVGDLVKGVGKAYDYSTVKGLPIGGGHEVLKQTLQDHTMQYVTNMGDALKQDLRDVLQSGLDNKLMPNEIAQAMMDKVDSVNKTRAEVIARTETMRASNMSQWYVHKDNDFKFYTVDFASDCCDDCAEAYDGNVYDIDDLENFPPELHPNCRCVPLFHEENPLGEDALVEYNPEEAPVEEPQVYEEMPISRWDQMDWVNANFDYSGSGLTGKEQEALSSYTGSYYAPINELLRGLTTEEKLLSEGWDATDLKLIKQYTQDLTTMINKTETEINIKTYKGYLEAPFFDNLKPGNIFNDEAFLSTGMDRNIASGFRGGRYGGDKQYIAEVFVPKGSNAIQVEKGLGKTGLSERELLLQRGSKYEVLSNDNVNKVIQLRLIV